MSLLGHAPVTSPLTQIPFQRLDHLPVVPKLRTELNTWAFQRYSNNLASSPQKKSYQPVEYTFPDPPPLLYIFMFLNKTEHHTKYIIVFPVFIISICSEHLSTPTHIIACYFVGPLNMYVGILEDLTLCSFFCPERQRQQKIHTNSASQVHIQTLQSFEPDCPRQSAPDPSYFEPQLGSKSIIPDVAKVDASSVKCTLTPQKPWRVALLALKH